MDEELKPCPYCGGDAVIDDSGHKGRRRVYCSGHIGSGDSGCMAEMTEWASPDIIDSWNRRATPAPTRPRDLSPDDWARLEAIRGRCEAATPGEWIVMPSDCGHLRLNGNGEEIASQQLDGYEDRLFVEKSREDIPYLLDLVETLVSRLAEKTNDRLRAGRR